MLTLTNSYWCFFINESDMTQTAWRRSRSRTEMKLHQDLAEMNLMKYFKASVFLCIMLQIEVADLEFLVEHWSVLEGQKKSSSFCKKMKNVQECFVLSSIAPIGQHCFCPVHLPLSFYFPTIPENMATSFMPGQGEHGQCVCLVTLQWFPSKGHHSP